MFIYLEKVIETVGYLFYFKINLIYFQLEVNLKQLLGNHTLIRTHY